MTTTPEEPGIVRPAAGRVCEPSLALQAWALVAYGRVKSWRPEHRSGGAPDVCDWHQSAAFKVELFFERPGYRRRWRELARVLEIEGREPTMREMPEAMEFASRFRRYWRKHGIAPPKEWE